MKAAIWNLKAWIKECRPEELTEGFDGILRASGFKVLQFVEHHFTPYGYTALWLLGESHFAVHTFPEEARSYVELSSCNERFYGNFCELMKKRFSEVKE